jgi:hypothetical protein
MHFDEHGHVRITPKHVHKLAFDDPDQLINHWLVPGTPWAFVTCENYSRFVDYLADHTGIHPHHFLFRGSTKIGFSISPNRDVTKIWRRFGETSDIDLAITDPHFYATLDEQVRQWDRQPENRQNVYRFKSNNIEFKRYKDRIFQKGRHDCYRFFDLPPKLPCIDALDKVLRDAPRAEYCVHPFVDIKAFIFRDRWSVHRRYHTDLDDLRRELSRRYDPLTAGPDEPFPAIMP